MTEIKEKGDEERRGGGGWFTEERFRLTTRATVESQNAPLARRAQVRQPDIVSPAMELFSTWARGF